jgi:hypothetical protein
VQDPTQTRPANMASTSPCDPLAGHEAHLTSLTHARLGIREPEPVGRLRADALAAPVCGRAPAHRLTAMRWASDGETPGHGAPAIHMTPAPGPEIDKIANGPRSRADGQHQHASMSAAAHDEVHPLPDDREAGQ